MNYLEHHYVKTLTDIHNVTHKVWWNGVHYGWRKRCDNSWVANYIRPEETDKAVVTCVVCAVRQ